MALHLSPPLKRGERDGGAIRYENKELPVLVARLAIPVYFGTMLGIL